MLTKLTPMQATRNPRANVPRPTPAITSGDIHNEISAYSKTSSPAFRVLGPKK
jgi:hypothetical protein